MNLQRLLFTERSDVLKSRAGLTKSTFSYIYKYIEEKGRKNKPRRRRREMPRGASIDEDYGEWTKPERIDVRDVRGSPVNSMTLSEVIGVGKRTGRRPVKKYNKRRKCAQCRRPVSAYTPPVRIPKKEGGFRMRLLCHGCRTINL